ncbi:MAG: MurR/RpiR family transcriptional regulator [Oscillospiraceae bacterium]|nr:MurR/RpiR family transcriptional regulator [Oscillospiraceae bacterium]
MIKHLITRIEMQMPKFSKGQVKIARFIEQNYAEAAYMTAARLGDTVGVSESTVVRFAMELGYSGYPQLQRAMQEIIRDKLTSVQRIDVTAERIGTDHVLDSVLNQDIERIRRTLEETSHTDFEQAVEAIVKAKKIYIFAVRSAASIANFLGYYLELCFGNVRVINATGTVEIYEHLFRLSGDDVLIGISFPRYSSMSVRAMEFARERGAHTVAITDSLVSPLVPAADSVLLARSDMASIVDSLVAPMSLINALIVATVVRKKDDVKATFSTLEEVWNNQDVYTKLDAQAAENTQ